MLHSVTACRQSVRRVFDLGCVVGPTNCANDFSRDEFMTYGFVFEDFSGAVCLPPGV